MYYLFENASHHIWPFLSILSILFLGSGEQYKIVKLRLKISTFKFTTAIYFSLKARESCYFGVEGNKCSKKLTTFDK